MRGWILAAPANTVDTRRLLDSPPRAGSATPTRSCLTVAAADALVVPSTPRCGMDGATPDRGVDDPLARDDGAGGGTGARRTAATPAGWWARDTTIDRPRMDPAPVRDGWTWTSRTWGTGSVMAAGDNVPRREIRAPAPTVRDFPTMRSMTIPDAPAAAAARCSRWFLIMTRRAREILGAVGAVMKGLDPFLEGEGPVDLHAIPHARNPGPVRPGRPRLLLLRWLALRSMRTNVVGWDDRPFRWMTAVRLASSSPRCFGQLSVHSPLRSRCLLAPSSTIPSERSVFFDYLWARRRVEADGNTNRD